MSDMDELYTAELHLHTCYSFLEGASQPDELAAQAAALGYRALANTDHDGLHGAMAFALACAAVGIRPITGVEITLAHGLADAASGPVHLTLLAESDRGYANLCRLLTEAHRDTRAWNRGLWVPVPGGEDGPPPGPLPREGEERFFGSKVGLRPTTPPREASSGSRRGEAADAGPRGAMATPPREAPSDTPGDGPRMRLVSGSAPTPPPRGAPSDSREPAPAEGVLRTPTRLEPSQTPQDADAWQGFGGAAPDGVLGRSPNFDPKNLSSPSPAGEGRGVGQKSSPALDPAFIVGHVEGVIALSGCRSGEVARLLDTGRLDDAEEAARRLAALFGRSNAYLELQHNLVRGDTRRLSLLAELGERLGMPLVATGNVHYHERHRHRLQDALVAIQSRSTLEGSHRQRRPNSEFYLRPRAEVAALFQKYPEALKNVGALAERCRDFNLADRRDLGYDFPDFTRAEGERHASADDVLADFCRAKFAERYPEGSEPALRAKAAAQLEVELALVARLHLSGFFLIYRDLQEMATTVARDVRGAGTVRGGSGLPPGRGRGSSVSSIICYLIGLSHVDPVKNRLFFRRFLNEDLQSVPDIDIDFARDIREELILRVYERYGHEHAALVCNFATYHLRSAVRDLGKVLGLPPAAIDKLARLSEGHGADTVARELGRIDSFQGQADGPLWQHLIDLARQIDGFPRHVGQHVGGMIISSRPLIEMVPVQPASMEGRFICQWDKDSCDDARFIKIDFLALGMLSLVEECLELAWQARGEKVRLEEISYDDPAVYDQICAGDTVGLFQIESRAQIQMLTRSQPRNLDDLAVQVAIVRPGPIVGGAVNPYVRRRELQRALAAQGKTYVPRADHPMLDKLLADTLGVVLYQDQVLEVAIEMGQFTPGQADQFRRSMSRRRSREAMERFKEDFIRGATAPRGGQTANKHVSTPQAGVRGADGTKHEGPSAAPTSTARPAPGDPRPDHGPAYEGAPARSDASGSKETTPVRPVTRAEAEAIFLKLCGFSEFGFPKSHAYAFAVLAYQSAWLRHYYTAEFYAALLNNQPMGFYAPHVLVGRGRPTPQPPPVRGRGRRKRTLGRCPNTPSGSSAPKPPLGRVVWAWKLGVREPPGDPARTRAVIGGSEGRARSGGSDRRGVRGAVLSKARSWESEGRARSGGVGAEPQPLSSLPPSRGRGPGGGAEKPSPRLRGPTVAGTYYGEGHFPRSCPRHRGGARARRPLLLAG
ncbi:MAG: DNA polymerase III subunit alpha [Chloroflexi bacterium]|nr:DNA polymerase III subunit alpha [Chloroflexota bacterium]